MFDLRGKVAVVTGAASGIGLATAKMLAEKGSKVVLSDYVEPAGKAAAEELRAKGADAIFIMADVSSEESIKSLVAETVKKYGKLDVMINNAGIGVMKASDEMTLDEYRRVITINQDGVFLGSKYAIIEMLKTGGGAIVNVSSILGLVGQPQAMAYNASKGAVTILSKSLAAEYASRNIRVNTVHPGYVITGMVNPEALGPDMYNGLVTLHPIGRLGEADEIAHGIVFLCENEFTTGAALVIDGGYTAV